MTTWALLSNRCNHNRMVTCFPLQLINLMSEMKKITMKIHYKNLLPWTLSNTPPCDSTVSILGSLVQVYTVHTMYVFKKKWNNWFFVVSHYTKNWWKRLLIWGKFPLINTFVRYWQYHKTIMCIKIYILILLFIFM